MTTKTIGTHDGTFHCDEALACFLLHQTSEFKDAAITRSRDPKILDTLDCLVDVGGVYDPSRHRYDHHQGTFQDTMNEKQDIRLSSAGLIYKHFGHEVLKNLTGLEGETLELVFDKIYSNFIKAVDAIDNGVSQYDTDQAPRYVVTTDLGSRVSHLNPSWNEEGTVDPNEQFKLAMALTGTEFTGAVNRMVNSWLPARTYVEEMFNNRKEIEKSGAIGILPHFCPWKSHLFDIEEETGQQNQMQYVLYQDSKSGWRIQSVSKTISSFENRAPLPEAWRGLRDEELSKVAGIEGCVFAHANGFIGGNATKEGVLKMARESLKLQGKGDLVE